MAYRYIVLFCFLTDTFARNQLSQTQIEWGRGGGKAWAARVPNGGSGP